MALDPDGPKNDLTPMFELIINHVPAPTIEEGPFRLLATTLEADPFLGRILTGRITSGIIKPNQQLKALSRDGKVVEVLPGAKGAGVSAVWNARPPNWLKPATSSQ